MPLNWNDETIPSEADKTTDILGFKEIGGIGQLIYHPFRFKKYELDIDKIEFEETKTYVAKTLKYYEKYKKLYD